MKLTRHLGIFLSLAFLVINAYAATTYISGLAGPAITTHAGYVTIPTLSIFSDTPVTSGSINYGGGATPATSACTVTRIYNSIYNLDCPSALYSSSSSLNVIINGATLGGGPFGSITVNSNVEFSVNSRPFPATQVIVSTGSSALVNVSSDLQFNLYYPAGSVPTYQFYGSVPTFSPFWTSTSPLSFTCSESYGAYPITSPSSQSYGLKDCAPSQASVVCSTAGTATTLVLNAVPTVPTPTFSTLTAFTYNQQVICFLQNIGTPNVPLNLVTNNGYNGLTGAQTPTLFTPTISLTAQATGTFSIDYNDGSSGVCTLSAGVLSCPQHSYSVIGTKTVTFAVTNAYTPVSGPLTQSAPINIKSSVTMYGTNSISNPQVINAQASQQAIIPVVAISSVAYPLIAAVIDYGDGTRNVPCILTQFLYTTYNVQCPNHTYTGTTTPYTASITTTDSVGNTNTLPAAGVQISNNPYLTNLAFTSGPTVSGTSCTFTFTFTTTAPSPTGTWGPLGTGNVLTCTSSGSPPVYSCSFTTSTGGFAFDINSGPNLMIQKYVFCINPATLVGVTITPQTTTPNQFTYLTFAYSKTVTGIGSQYQVSAFINYGDGSTAQCTTTQTDTNIACPSHFYTQTIAYQAQLTTAFFFSPITPVASTTTTINVQTVTVPQFIAPAPSISATGFVATLSSFTVFDFYTLATASVDYNENGATAFCSITPLTTLYSYRVACQSPYTYLTTGTKTLVFFVRDSFSTTSFTTTTTATVFIQTPTAPVITAPSISTPVFLGVNIQVPTFTVTDTATTLLSASVNFETGVNANCNLQQISTTQFAILCQSQYLYSTTGTKTLTFAVYDSYNSATATVLVIVNTPPSPVFLSPGSIPNVLLSQVSTIPVLGVTDTLQTITTASVLFEGTTTRSCVISGTVPAPQSINCGSTYLYSTSGTKTLTFYVSTAILTTATLQINTNVNRPYFAFSTNPVITNPTCVGRSTPITAFTVSDQLTITSASIDYGESPQTASCRITVRTSTSYLVTCPAVVYTQAGQKTATFYLSDVTSTYSTTLATNAQIAPAFPAITIVSTISVGDPVVIPAFTLPSAVQSVIVSFSGAGQVTCTVTGGTNVQCPSNQAFTSTGNRQLILTDFTSAQCSSSTIIPIVVQSRCVIPPNSQVVINEGSTFNLNIVPFTTLTYRTSIDWGDGTAALFSAATITTTGTAFSHTYVFDNTNPKTIHAFTCSGTTSACTTAATGCQSTFSVSVTVNNVPPVIPTVTLPTPVNIYNSLVIPTFTVTDYQTVSTVKVVYYDGATPVPCAVATNAPYVATCPSYTYQSIGNKVVTFIASDYFGATSSRTALINVVNTPCGTFVPANFTLTTITGGNSYVLSFSSNPNSGSTLFSLTVDWGDGSTQALTGQSPTFSATHTYSTASASDIPKSVVGFVCGESSGACTSSTCKTSFNNLVLVHNSAPIFLPPLPQIPIQISVSFALQIPSFLVRDTTSATIDYGDSSNTNCQVSGTQPSTVICPSHFYSQAPINPNVQITLTGSSGTTTVTSQVVSVILPITCGTMVIPSLVNAGEIAEFTFVPNPELSTNYNLSLTINPGGGLDVLNSVTPANRNTVYTFTYPNNGTVTFTVQGCVNPQSTQNCLLCNINTQQSFQVLTDLTNLPAASIPSPITVSLAQPLPAVFDTQNADIVYITYGPQPMTICPTVSNGGGSYTATCPAPNPPLGVGQFNVEVSLYNSSNGAHKTYITTVNVTL